MIASRRRSMSRTTFSESFALPMNGATVPFSSNSSDCFSISSNALQGPLVKAGGAGSRGSHLVNSLRRPSGSPSTVVVVMSRLNLYSWGLRYPIFSSTFLNSCDHPCQPCATVIHSTNTSKRLMRALTPPRAGLRGGNQSADSSAMSRRIFASSVAFCFFAGTSRAVGGLTLWRVLNPLTSTLIQVTPRCSGFCPFVFAKHHVFASSR